MIDPMRRRASEKSDLFAIGCANLVAGMLGGIPMISEVVRSKTNIDVGAQSAWSNTTHGLLLLAYLILFGAVIDRIPLAALAGMLVYIGLRLAHPVHFKHAYHAGLELASLFHSWVGLRPKDFLFLRSLVTKHQNARLAKIEGPATFSNFFRIGPAIEAQLHGAQKVTFDLSGAPVVDHTLLEKNYKLKGEYAQLTVESVGWKDHKNLLHHPNGTRVHRR
jgi:MFS superfamily sulfate permease-like transporter